MINTILRKIVGTRNERVIKGLSKTVLQINQLESAMQKCSDTELSAKTAEFRARLKQGETLDALLPEAFAAVREASVRTLGMRHFDVQLIGGIVLHQGKIAEMRTGEGKTLAATLPVYLNALTGKGVHVVTVNDYLAKRDAEWMEPIYTLLGLTVGINLSGSSHEAKQKAYAADVTYGTNNEFGFDYLRDNMAFSLDQYAQRGQAYAIVDEVDSILIDEARTPLIISGPTEETTDLYVKINDLVPELVLETDAKEAQGDYTIDEKTRQAFLTEAGHQKVETLFTKAGLLQTGASLYDVRHISLMHHLNAALRAHALFQRDVEYIVKDNEVVIVDEHTGRLMPGRRWSEGLHQAVEAKEGVAIQNENQTLASITFQNYFRLYAKLAGMTGTADTEAFEFQQIYGLEVVVIPTNKPIVRKDLDDEIYLTSEAKFKAIVRDIKARQKKGQPILVGTASIESSERLAALLKREKIKHEVLNAKYHEKEAHIIAQAGRAKAVTIATNMAGRGTDIVLGGKPDEKGDLKAWQARHAEVIAAGGLHILGTERNESRRIDNQLRGRAGRQGDPGSSQFYLSLEDDLLRIFASDRVSSIMRRVGMKEDEAIRNPLITRSIESAQRKVEGHNFEIRKSLLEFDDVANDQRQVIYHQRYDLMKAEDISATIRTLQADVAQSLIAQYLPEGSFEEQWDAKGLEQILINEFEQHLNISQWIKEEDSVQPEQIKSRIAESFLNKLSIKEEQYGSIVMRQLEKTVMLQSLDQLWKEHLSSMDHLRQGIHLRGYAQKNPVQEFKREAFELFSELLERVKYDVISHLCLIHLGDAQEDMAELEQQREALLAEDVQFEHASMVTLSGEHEQAETATATIVRSSPKVGRNEPCPCASGVKYKHCCGKVV